MPQKFIKLGNPTASTVGRTMRVRFTLSIGGSAMTSGTVTAKFTKTDYTTNLTGGGIPVTCSHQGSGVWLGVFSGTLQNLGQGKSAVLFVNADDGGGNVLEECEQVKFL